MKDKLNILAIDRELKPNEYAVKHIFPVYGETYDIIMFPTKEGCNELLIQLVFYKYSLISTLEKIFQQKIDFDGNDTADFFSLDITNMKQDVFYDILADEFEIIVTNLTTLETRNEKKLQINTICPRDIYPDSKFQRFMRSKQ